MKHIKGVAMIKVGFQYKTMPKFNKSHIVHIFHKVNDRSERPFYGLRDDGVILDFDESGCDEWFECGGHWNQLDLSTELPSSVKLVVE